MKYESDTRKYCLNFISNDTNLSDRIETIFFNLINKG